MYRDGHTLDQCAAVFGISKQRAQQIIQALGVTMEFIETLGDEFTETEILEALQALVDADILIEIPTTADGETIH